MVKRLFWFAVGAGAAVFVYVKLREQLAKARPEAIGQRVSDSASGILDSARDFAGRVREGMAEREAELREMLTQSDE